MPARNQRSSNVWLRTNRSPPATTNARSKAAWRRRGQGRVPPRLAAYRGPAEDSRLAHHGTYRMYRGGAESSQGTMKLASTASRSNRDAVARFRATPNLSRMVVLVTCWRRPTGGTRADTSPESGPRRAFSLVACDSTVLLGSRRLSLRRLELIELELKHNLLDAAPSLFANAKPPTERRQHLVARVWQTTCQLDAQRSGRSLRGHAAR